MPQTTAILPRSEELLTPDGSLPLDAGASYRARATLEYGGEEPAVAEVDFTPQAALAIVGLGAEEGGDQGTTIRLGLRNDGELGLLPRIQFALRDADGKTLGTAVPSTPPLVWPGQIADIEAPLPRQLSGGEYVLVARVEYGTAPAIEREAPLRIGAPPVANPGWGEAPARATEPRPAAAAGAAWWPVAALVGLLLLVSSLAWLPRLAPVRRRLRRAASALREDA
jgi:hypothetical protein